MSKENMTADQHMTWCAVWNKAILQGIKPYIAVKMAYEAASKVTT